MLKSKPFYKEVISYVFVTFLAINVFKLLILIHWPNVAILAGEAQHVIDGNPCCFAFQSRILAPYLILLISMIGVNFFVAWKIYHAICLEVLCILLFSILRRESLSTKLAFNYLVCFLFSFLLMQHDILHTWDAIDLIIFTAFAYGILKSFSISFFVLLFAIGIFNRESAMFLAFYLTLNSFEFRTGKIFPSFRNFKSLLVGSVLMVLGAVYTNFIRHALYVGDKQIKLKGNFMGNYFGFFKNNIKQLFYSNYLIENFKDFPISSVPLFVCLFLCYFAMHFRRMNDRQVKLFVVALVMFLNVLIFGFLNETRLYFVFLPFFLFLWLSIHNKIGFNFRK